MTGPSATTRRKLTIRDLLIATTIIAAMLGVAYPIQRIIAAPNKFADSLGHQTAGMMMIVCTIGLIGFPLAILIAGILVLRKSNSPLKMFYAIVVLVLAVASIPIAYIVGRACAYSIV